MAKKSSMPDFTFALGADLREAAAKMRKMSQPPKHQSAQQSDEAIDAMSDDAEITVESSAVEPPFAEESLTPPSSDATIGVDVSSTDLPYCKFSLYSVIPTKFGVISINTPFLFFSVSLTIPLTVIPS